MVTGDNIDTARAIAKKCGITTGNDGYLIMDGKEFNKKIVDHTGEVGVVWRGGCGSRCGLGTRWVWQWVWSRHYMLL